MSERTAERVVSSEFIVRIDTREQSPWMFEGLCAGADQDYAPIDVRTEVGTLTSGDYSIVGFETAVAIERKSLEDLYSTLTAGRQRFVRELERMAELEMAAVIVEAGWHEIAHEPPPRSRAHPRSIVGSIIAFQQRYPTVSWLTAGSRRIAEGLAYRSLERFWLDTRNGKKTIRWPDQRKDFVMRHRGPVSLQDASGGHRTTRKPSRLLGAILEAKDASESRTYSFRAKRCNAAQTRKWIKSRSF